MSLHYPWPVIRHLNDVIPHIEGRPEFIKVEKDGGYTVVNYVFQGSDTFPTVQGHAEAVLRECRGLIFETATGRIASRRFQKFFNAGERADSVIDVSREHYVLEKLDGSMISPLRIGGGIRWVSKMGVTDVSMQAEMFVADRPTYAALADDMLELGETPIFEWQSRKQRIVLDYPEDRLTLLAIRDNVTGEYLDRRDVEQLAEAFGIPVVEAIAPSIGDFDAFITELRKREDAEGVVITFADGHMVKVKTDWYVQLHRAKDQISRERHLIALLLEDKVDDLLPVLPQPDRERVERFGKALAHDLVAFAGVVGDMLHGIRLQGQDRKTFALSSDDLPQPVRAACFQLFDTPSNEIDAGAFVWGRRFVLKNLASAASLEKARGVLQTARWDEQASE